VKFSPAWQLVKITEVSLSYYLMTKARKTQKTTDGSLSTHNGFSLISNEKLLEIYSMMLKCRMLE